MRRLRPLPAVVATLLVLACGAPEDPAPAGDAAPAPDPAPPADATVRADDPPPPGGFTCENLIYDLLPVDPSRATLAERFGPPARIEARTEPNRHVPGQTDSIFNIHYPGLEAVVRVAGGREMRDHVMVADGRYLRTGAPGIGDTAEEVIATLGQPTRRTASTLVYECGEGAGEPVTFHLEDGVVARVELDYYLD